MSAEDSRPLNPHVPAPAALRQLFRDFKALAPKDIDAHPRIIDLNRPAQSPRVVKCSSLRRDDMIPVFEKFLRSSGNGHDDLTAVNANGQAAATTSVDQGQGEAQAQDDFPVYTLQGTTGLRIVPGLLPPAVQTEVLSRLLHRDLADERHTTNLHLHYDVTYPGSSLGDGERSLNVNTRNDHEHRSFFADYPARTILPKDPSLHKPITIHTLLSKKLRWMTLGGQYDWTSKIYPALEHPQFPPDLTDLVAAIFPDVHAQAAIVNSYSTGDILSVHRDVSESCDVALVSISFGCDALFLIGHDDEQDGEIIRLRSGDVVYMGGKSRFAWHAVPRTIADTCPEWLQAWPAANEPSPQGADFEQWRGWMGGKRINFNIRQMKE